MAKELNLKNKSFVNEYLIDLNATQAAIRAGYSKKTAGSIGHELLQKPEIQDAIAQSFEERSNETKIDAAYVLTQAVKLHERCMQEIRPKLVKDGPNWVHDTDADGNLLFVFDSTGAAKGLDIVGKHVDVQAFKESMNHMGSIAITPPIIQFKEPDESDK